MPSVGHIPHIHHSISPAGIRSTQKRRRNSGNLATPCSAGLDAFHTAPVSEYPSFHPASIPRKRSVGYRLSYANHRVQHAVNSIGGSLAISQELAHLRCDRCIFDPSTHRRRTTRFPRKRFPAVAFPFDPA